MDSQFETKKEINPRQKSNILSKITFWYALPLLTRGFKKELEEDDLYQVLPEFKSKKLGDRIEYEWDKLKVRKKWRMFLLLWNLLGMNYLLLGLSKLIVTIVLNVLRPVIIGKFVSYFVPGQTEVSKEDAYLYCCILIVLNIIDTLYRQNYQILAESLGIKLRIAVTSLIYRKSLNLSVNDLQSVPFGEMANFMTRDINCFNLFFFVFNDSWTGLVSMVIVLYQMYYKIGLTVLVIVAALAILIPSLVAMGIKTTLLKIKTSEKTDERINLLEEVLSKIKSMKMYVWETHVEERITEARKKEMGIFFIMCLFVILTLVIAMLVYHVAYYFILMTCIWMGQVLTAEIMYFVTSSYQSMTYTVVIAVPYATTTASQLSAALKRLQTIVERLDIETKKTKYAGCESSEPRIAAKNVAIQSGDKILLENVDFDIGRGLTILLGHASSGKSTLLMTIMKELEVTKGSLVAEGRISYVSQEPWLFPSTIKQNVLFGAKYNEKRYNEVVEVCALDYDFHLLEKGDDTIVADQGLNLSKGQQSRICLARAVYRESDIYLIDDCLSNLDPLVANIIFNKCILGFLKDKLILLVSDKLNFVPSATRIIKLNNFRLEILKNDNPKVAESFQLSDSLNYDYKPVNLEQFDSNPKLLATQIPKNKVYGENKKEGTVSLRAYKRYINLGGGKLFVFTIFCVFVVGQLSFTYKDKLVSGWADLEEKIANSTNYNSSLYDKLEEERNMILYIYTATTFIIVCIVMLRGCLVYVFTRKASISLHKKMVNSVLNAPTKFFDSTFIGNIVNRFSKDLVTVDEDIPFILLHLISILFETIGSLVLIALVNPKFLIPTAILFVSSILLRLVYLKTGRALKRLEATTKSPIVGYLNATLKGLSTIKTFGAENILKEEFDKHQDVYSSASYSNLCCIKAFAFAVDSLSSIFTSLLVLKFLIFNEEISPGDVGLTVVQGSMISVILYWGFQKWADLETLMTSAERAFEYTDIKQEKKSGLVLEKWPTFGEIKFENVFLHFDNCKSSVLKNVNFSIAPGEKIGIVGRTGAGKSSIISSIFRLYEVQGNIIIDGVNIKTLSLDFLRSNISVIPQDPLLLNGTIRYNIDPQGTYNDEELCKVIKNVKLERIYPSLDTEIIDAEVTFSQKQLICLARVLLRKNQILLLDEISENGDAYHESLIYDIIDQHFGSCTVIKITHKMKFVMNCDRIFVIEKGEIVECDSPQKLLGNTNSVFYKMVEKSGLDSALFQ